MYERIFNGNSNMFYLLNVVFFIELGICLFYLGGCLKIWCFLIFLNEIKVIKICIFFYIYIWLVDELIIRRKNKKKGKV